MSYALRTPDAMAGLNKAKLRAIPRQGREKLFA